MSTARMTQLPSELLVEILQNLDVLNLIHCSLTCRLFYQIIRDTPLLQYHISLELSGFQDCGTSSKLTTAERLAELQTQRDNWTNLRFREWDVFPLSENIRVWELAGGVIAHGLPTEELTRGLAFVELPSVSLGTPRRSWKLQDLGISIRDFTMDPCQDLLVVIGSPSASQARERKVYLFSMSTGEVHPSATSNPLTCSLEHATDSFGSFVIQIMDDVVGVFARSRRIRQLLIWNWKSGTLLIDYVEGLPKKMESFTFLSHDYFLLSTINRSQFATSLPLLQVFEFRDPEALPFTLTPRLVRTFKLPPLEDGSLVDSMNIRLEPPPWHSSQLHRRGKPFTTGRGSQVLAITIDIFKPGQVGQLFSHILFVHLSTLLDEYSSMHSVVPWNIWGPGKTRLLLRESSDEGWVCYIHGSRYVTLEHETSRLRMLDFNPWPMRQIQLQHRTSDSDSDKEGTSQSGQQINREASCQIICASNPTKLPRGFGFRKEIETRLPYRDILSDDPVDFVAVMIEEECLVGLRRTSTHFGREIKVLCF